MAVDQNKIHRLSLSEDVEDRLEAARLLHDEVESLLDKSAAWDDIHRLITDDNSLVREITTSTIGCFFKYIPEESKSIAWNYLVERVEEVNSDEDLMPVREAAYALCRSFEYVPDDNKPQAWLYLTKFPVDGHFIDVIDDVASSLRYLFDFIPQKYKSQAWDDLVELMHTNNFDVKRNVVFALSNVYSSIPEISTVWNDLHSLINDDDSYVRMYANHSLGKICIYKASKSDNIKDSKALLEDAIRYFEKAANETERSNPARFCHLFYRSFNALFLKTIFSKKDIDNYIAAAKKEIEDSKSRTQLIEVVGQLAEVLETARTAKGTDIDRKELLKHCSDICNHVDQLMDENKDKTPAIFELYKKARPSFDQSIKKLIEDVKGKAEAACREAKGTAAQQAICEINREVQELTIGSQEYMKKQVQTLYRNLKSSVPDKEEYKLIHLEIDSILNEQDLVNQYCSLNMLLPKIIQINVVEATCSVADEIKLLREAVDKLIELVDELQNPQEYVDVILRNLEEIKDEIPGMKKQIDEVLYELYSPMGVDQKLKVALPIIPMLVSYELEMNAPKFLVDRIDDLKKLVMKGKK